MNLNLCLIFILNLNTLTYSLNITETTKKIKYLIKNYNNTRFIRKINKFDIFLQESVDLFNKTQRYKDFLTNFDVIECADVKSGENKTKYVKRHILDGMLVHDDLPHSHWLEYKTVYNKEYATFDHEMAALSSWLKNLRLVAQHNQQYLDGKHSYSLHLNHLGDLHRLDYINKLLKHKFTLPLFDSAQDHFRSAYHKNKQKVIPKHLDWRSKGYRPKLEEQLKCGACYAFAVTHAVQAQIFKRHGDWQELSPQQIVDCSGVDGNKGCDGGSLPAALRYAARDGLVTEANYPYIAERKSCHLHPFVSRIRPRRWAMLPPGDDAAVEKALATIGPLAVAVNALPFTFQLYRSGIYDDIFCAPWPLNHAMLLVGYTPEYWILLNWWGENWGEDGYIRIRRGFNRCGITNMATYVEL